MKTPKQSLRKIVTFLNNPEEDGGFWLPNIQRQFVWNREQICRLFDSILREYPISTLLIWKTRAKVRHRKFIDNYHSGLRLRDFYVPESSKKKCLVLDGQQRLQSLFIGLSGSYKGQELFLDILSGEVEAPDDMKYKFEFLKPSEATFPWIKFKDVVFSKKDGYDTTQDIIKEAGRELSDEEKKKVGKHVSIIFKTFHSDDGISYQELDNTEEVSLYNEDDVVEVFIRANSGGTRLSKSDLLFSLLTAGWDFADEQMESLLEELNSQGFLFTRDFILKTCLTLLDQGASYEVSKFRKPGIREKIEQEWDNIANSIKYVLDIVEGKTFIRCDKALPSYLVLIPIVYVHYHYPSALEHARDIDEYLLRSLLTTAFSGTPDQLINECVNSISKIQQFDTTEMFGIIRSQGRNLKLTNDQFWQMGYGSKTIHLLFNLWYRDFHYTPSYQNNWPQIDHIFPQSALKKIKVVNPETGRLNLMKYRQKDRDQLANCMLLTAKENGAGGKSDTLPEDWFSDKGNEYLDMHLIPKASQLWKMDRFEDFIEERKKLIASRFGNLLSD